MMTASLARGDFFAHLDECLLKGKCCVAVPHNCTADRDGDFTFRQTNKGITVKVKAPFCQKHLREYEEQAKNWYDGKEAVAAEA